MSCPHDGGESGTCDYCGEYGQLNHNFDGSEDCICNSCADEITGTVEP
jgi:formylmethanofuran dehydrogenase subunit E